MKNREEKKYISTAELAKMLGISRVAIFNRIKKGQIPAIKIGHSYAILMDDANKITQGISVKILTQNQKELIESAVEKTVKEYGETLRLLGKE